MNDIDTMIEVLQAIKAGKEIQVLHDSVWRKAHTNKPSGLNFLGCKFRVKPEPKVIYVNEYKNGMYYVHEDYDECVRSQSGTIRTAVKYVEAIE